MASLAARSVVRTSTRCIHSSRCAAEKAMPTALEHSTGIERREREAIAAGNENPFDMRIIKRISGATQAKPTAIPSAFEKRIMGCVCDEGDTTINWMWIYRGQPKRCECGYWFNLVQSNPV